MKLTKYLSLVALSIAIAILLRLFVFRTYLVTSNSMFPTLSPGDHILSLNIRSTFMPIYSNDIIIFETLYGLKAPSHAEIFKKKLFIKRVVEVKSNLLSNYFSYFVAGDNSLESVTKSEIGEVFCSNIVGLPIILYYPLNRITWLQ